MSVQHITMQRCCLLLLKGRYFQLRPATASSSYPHMCPKGCMPGLCNPARPALPGQIMHAC